MQRGPVSRRLDIFAAVLSATHRPDQWIRHDHVEFGGVPERCSNLCSENVANSGMTFSAPEVWLTSRRAKTLEEYTN